MTAYAPPRVTFVGSDPKIPALRAAIKRLSRVGYLREFYWYHHGATRFVGLWQARNRRTRVLMAKVQDANNVSR